MGAGGGGVEGGARDEVSAPRPGLRSETRELPSLASSSVFLCELCPPPSSVFMLPEESRHVAVLSTSRDVWLGVYKKIICIL